MKHLVRKTTTNNFEAFGKARWSSWIPSVLFNLCKITTDWITIVVKDPAEMEEIEKQMQQLIEYKKCKKRMLLNGGTNGGTKENCATGRYSRCNFTN
ncbi:uncharacterized protein LOC107012444 isoform X4 [Solanum pennellii]|uniref:Uncharacterized protein LOC107012444 isoform X4 n=1 Tax=Solanum pennellii TaxID=28526 RepID=A0ABM1V5A0_SOLPN|nr:uncharacterized protein LOC107012444 isoform X4 [Solanum pennellii]